MKVKTDNIDILEEMLKNTKTNKRGNKEIKFEVNSNYYTAISNLIAENKELKEENEKLKNEEAEIRISTSAHNRIMQLEKENAKLQSLLGKE